MLMATLRNVGGSVMFAIPKAILEGLDLRANTSVAVSIADGRLIVDPHPKGRRYTLAELLAECDLTAESSAEERVWTSGPAVGSEAI